MWHRCFKSANVLSLLSLFAVHAYRVAEDPRLSDSSNDTEHWKLSEKPNLNDTTSNFIFETVNSLLQHWPNTRYRNGEVFTSKHCHLLLILPTGHTLAPATIPTGTLLYHGTTKPEIPKVPEWLATDPDHSYLFCGLDFFPPTNGSNGGANSASDDGCWHLTFATTQPLKLLYFDGSSAAKMSDGALDSQDLLTWGGVREDMVHKERERIDKLCEWGKKFKLDGFVR